MAHVWARSESGDWETVKVEGDAFGLVAGPRPLARPDSDGAVLCRRSVVSGREAWVLLSAPTEDLRVNGAPLPTGIRLLEDRDAIQLSHESLTYFSSERLAEVELFPGSPDPVYCPRCKTEIEAGTPAVRCPGCESWHHQSEVYGCWLYTERCALCDQPTALGAGFRWSPEDL
ncbi:MAG: hypothetical protein PVG79_01640 [Gemmatimonadales bacterium]|jgi:hypothetical protein